MTAEAVSGDRECCLEAGMNDYITKPIRVEELVAAIKRTPRREGPVAAPADDVDPIDRDVLARLAEGVCGDAEFVSELIQGFIDDAPALIATGRDGLGRGDAVEVRRAAHTLKSNAATFGAYPLSDLSRDLEEAAKREDLANAATMLDATEREVDVVLVDLPAAWQAMSEPPAE